MSFRPRRVPPRRPGEGESIQVLPTGSPTLPSYTTTGTPDPTMHYANLMQLPPTSDTGLLGHRTISGDGSALLLGLAEQATAPLVPQPLTILSRPTPESLTVPSATAPSIPSPHEPLVTALHFSAPSATSPPQPVSNGLARPYVLPQATTFTTNGMIMAQSTQPSQPPLQTPVAVTASVSGARVTNAVSNTKVANLFATHAPQPILNGAGGPPTNLNFMPQPQQLPSIQPSQGLGPMQMLSGVNMQQQLVDEHIRSSLAAKHQYQQLQQQQQQQQQLVQQQQQQLQQQQQMNAVAAASATANSLAPVASSSSKSSRRSSKSTSDSRPSSDREYDRDRRDRERTRTSAERERERDRERQGDSGGEGGSGGGFPQDKHKKRLERKAELARASRRRKKAYVGDLEDKLLQLANQNAFLVNLVNKLPNALSVVDLGRLPVGLSWDRNPNLPTGGTLRCQVEVRHKSGGGGSGGGDGDDRSDGEDGENSQGASEDEEPAVMKPTTPVVKPSPIQSKQQTQQQQQQPQHPMMQPQQILSQQQPQQQIPQLLQPQQMSHTDLAVLAHATEVNQFTQQQYQQHQQTTQLLQQQQQQHSSIIQPMASRLQTPSSLYLPNHPVPLSHFNGATYSYPPQQPQSQQQPPPPQPHSAQIQPISSPLQNTASDLSQMSMHPVMQHMRPPSSELSTSSLYVEPPQNEQSQSQSLTMTQPLQLSPSTSTTTPPPTTTAAPLKSPPALPNGVSHPMVYGIKAQFRTDWRRFTLEPEHFTFTELQAGLKKLFDPTGAVGSFIVKYMDGDGDFISIHSTEELLEAYKHRRGKEHTDSPKSGELRLFITVADEDATQAPLTNGTNGTTTGHKRKSVTTIDGGVVPMTDEDEQKSNGVGKTDSSETNSPASKRIKLEA